MASKTSKYSALVIEKTPIDLSQFKIAVNLPNYIPTFFSFWMLSPIFQDWETDWRVPPKTIKNKRTSLMGYDVAPSGGRHLKKKNKFRRRSFPKKAIKQSDKEFSRQVYLAIESD